MAAHGMLEVLPPVLDSTSDQPLLFDGTTRLNINNMCPYAQRVWIVMNYKGLHDKIKLVPIDLQNRPAGIRRKSTQKISCVDNERSPVRATYDNLYKWPESDAEFVKSAAVHGGARLHSRVADSISCRQIYLRSYTFSREETLLEKTMKCLGKVREMVAVESKLRWRVVTMEVKDFSGAAFRAIFRWLRSCATPVDVEKLDFSKRFIHF